MSTIMPGFGSGLPQSDNGGGGTSDGNLIPVTIPDSGNVSPGQTISLYDDSSLTERKVWGCVVEGDSDARVALEVSGQEIDYDIISTINRIGRIRLPRPVVATSGTNIKITVKNIGPDTTVYRGVLQSG